MTILEISFKISHLQFKDLGQKIYTYGSEKYLLMSFNGTTSGPFVLDDYMNANIGKVFLKGKWNRQVFN